MYLSKEDQELFEQVVFAYGNTYIENIESVLFEWSHNKLQLYRAFGNNLRVVKEVEVTGDHSFVRKEIYNKKQKEVFPIVLSRQLCEKQAPQNVIEYCDRLRSTDWLANGFTKCEIKLPSGRKIPVGTRVMRAYGTVMREFNIHNEWFESFKNTISEARTKATNRKIKLTFSIHPVDFLLMSQNSNGWSSCFAPGHEQARSVIELMNAASCLLVYVDNEDVPFEINGRKLPNMVWRTTAYVNNEMVLMGKSYPFKDSRLTEQAINIVANLVKFQSDGQLRFATSDEETLQSIMRCPGTWSDFWFDPECEDFMYYRHKDRVHPKIFINNEPTCMCCGSTYNVIESNSWVCKDCLKNKRYDGIVYKREDIRQVPVASSPRKKAVPKFILASDYVLREDGVYEKKKGL